MKTSTHYSTIGTCWSIIRYVCAFHETVSKEDDPGSLAMSTQHLKYEEVHIAKWLVHS